MEAQPTTRMSALAASLSRAQADLAIARAARALCNDRYYELRALAAEQDSPALVARYTDASVIQAGQRQGHDHEIGRQLELIEQLKRAIARGDIDDTTAAERAAMDDTLEFSL